MGLLAKKLILLVLPAALFLAAIFFATGGSEKIKDRVSNKEVEAKIRAFIREDTRIIIAGDSRAERQLVPAIIERRTGMRTANVATAACDLITLHNAFKKHELLGGKRVLLVSTSSFQVNDGAIDPGYISTACMLNLSFGEKLSVYRKALWRLVFEMTKVALGGEDVKPAPIPDSQMRDGGFLGVEGKMKPPSDIITDPERTKHPWYKNISLDGARWRIFREALDKLDRSDCLVFIIQPPVSPAWREHIRGTFIEKIEAEYGKKLERETAGRGNMVFLDFYGEPPASLGNDKYYDIQHLNRAGAEEFTNIVLNRIGDDVTRWLGRERIPGPPR